MIGKCKAVGGSSAGMEYLFQDQNETRKTRGYELDRNMLIGETPRELVSEIKEWNRDNAHELKNEVFSMVLSPSGRDGKNLTDEQLAEISKEFIAQTLGIDPNKQPYYMRVHDETNNKHVHIYLPRTDANGKTISDKHCQFKAMDSADRIAESYGLIRAKIVHESKITQEKSIKDELKNQMHKISGETTSWEDFKKKVDKKGIKIDETINKQGRIQGYRISKGSISFKASEVDRKLTLSKLQETFKNNLLSMTENVKQSSRGLRR